MPAQSSVFMIGWEYPPHNSGGLGVACQGMTEALAEVGHHISFTLPYHFGGGASHMDIVSCIDPSWEATNNFSQPPFSVYESVIRVQNKTTSFNPDTMKHIPQSELETKVEQYAQQIIEQSKGRKAFDIIHAHDWLTFPAAVALKEKTGKPLIAHVHSSEYDRIPHGGGSPYIVATEKKGMEAADKIIAVSFYTKNILVKKYGVAAHKIEVVHNGISKLYQKSTQQSFAQERPVVAFLGRLTQQKGGQYFIYLAREVIKQVPNALFVMAGNGDMYHELLFSNAQHGLSAHMLFSGFVRDKQKEWLLSRADVFVMPSVSEPFGLVALEAAQHQTPVIVSKNTGVAEVLPSALQIDFWDVELMVKNVVNLLQKTKHHQTQVIAQNRDLEQITWDKSAQKIQDIYQSLS